MEDRHFDALTKKLAAPISRRAAVKAALVTAVGGAAGLARMREAGAQCPPGTTPCGIRCVTNCPAGQTLNRTTCQCVCGTGTVLCGGRCVSATCPTGASFNSATCSCQCPAGQIVVGGACQCTVSEAACNGICCPSGQACQNGVCTCTTPLCAGRCCAFGQVCDVYFGVCIGGFCSTIPPNTGPSAANCFVTCGSSVPSPFGGACFCIHTVEGFACVQPICGSGCTTSADCGSGAVCMTQGCCGPPPAGSTGICIPTCGAPVGVAAATARSTRRWGA